MNLALAEAKEALKNGEFPVGCILVAGDKVVASGSRHSSRVSRASSFSGADELDHAEIIAVRRLLEEQPTVDRTSVTVYSTLEPCLMCYSTLLINNFHSIVYAYEDALGGGTALKLAGLTPLYREMQITIIPHVLREESLRLFKAFFADPANTYLQDTYLAEYTLAQEDGTSR